jgi:hypothetical protein
MIAVPKCKIADSQVEIEVLPFAATLLLYIHSASAMVYAPSTRMGKSVRRSPRQRPLALNRAVGTQSRH